MAIEQGRERPLEQNMAARPAVRLGAAVRSRLALGVVIFLLALGPRLLNPDVFVGPDEFLWLARTADFAQAVAEGDFARTYQTGHPGVTLMWAETVGAWLRYGAQWLTGGPADWEAATGPDKTMATLAVKRQVIGVTNALLVALIALLAGRVFGPGVGWLTGFLLAFDPFLLAESRVLRPEGMVTAFSALGLLALLLYLKERRLVVCGLAGFLVGLALLSKVSAAALLPVGVVIIGGAPLLDRSRPWRRRWQEAAVKLAVWGGALLVTAWLLWPALWVSPGDVFEQLYSYSEERTVDGESSGGDAFFLGGSRPHAELGPLFYLLVLLYRGSPLLWPGLILLAVLAWRYRSLAGWQRLGLGLLVLYLAGYFALIAGSTLKFDRYVIPMLPGLILLAAIGLAAGWGWLAARWPGLAGWGWLAALLVLVGQIVLALPHHPYYYTYWNPLLGGPRQAVKVLPVGVGEGMDRAVAYLNALPDAEQLILASGSAQQISSVFKGRHIPLTNLVGEWFVADYTFVYIAQYQRGKYDPNILDYLRREPPVLTVTLNGLEYGWLYRGPGAMYFGGDTRLEGRATLHAYDLSETDLTAGEKLGVRVYFRNEGQQPADRFYVRLVDAAGYVWAEDTIQPRPGFEEAFTRREAIVEGEVELALPVGMPPGEYQLKLGYENRALGEAVGEFVLPANAPKIRVEAARGVPAAAAVALAETELEWQVGELALRGYSLAEREWLAGEATWLRLVWQALAEVEQDYVIGLQLLDGTGQEAAYWLGRPVLSGYATRGWQAGQVVLDPWRLELPEEVKPGEYELGLTVYDAGTQAAVGQVGLGQVTVVERRRSYELPEMGRVLNVDLSEGIRLLGYDLHAEPLPGGGRLRVVLYWQGQAEVGRSYTVFVQMLDPAGVLVAQHDGLPVEGTVPTTAWAAGEVIADRHLVEFGLLGPGEYRLVVGLYDRETGERLSVVDGPDYVELEPVVIE